MPEERAVPTGGDPAEVAITRESIRLAFVAALQQLPPRERAVLILREVLRWPAARGRRVVGDHSPRRSTARSSGRALAARGNASKRSPERRLDAEQTGLLTRYVEAFERYDMAKLTSLLHEDATWTMPPYALWLQTQ